MPYADNVDALPLQIVLKEPRITFGSRLSPHEPHEIVIDEMTPPFLNLKGNCSESSDMDSISSTCASDIGTYSLETFFNIPFLFLAR